MRAVGAVELRYADEHVPLTMLLGALGTLSALRRVLPASPVPRDPAGAGTEPDAFVFLLLGALGTHDRLERLCAVALAGHQPVRQPAASHSFTDDGGILR
jgi:hypothetical protein